MKNFLGAFIFSALLFSCPSDDNSGGGGNGGGLPAPSATYRVTFDANFTDQTHPQDYPMDAGFVKMFIVAHDANTRLFGINQIASAGFEAYVEDGETTELVNELTPQFDSDPPTVIVMGNDIGPTGTDIKEITVTPSTTLISVVIKIDPSPDWFVGVDAFDIVNPDNTLVELQGFQLLPIDAGTDAGTMYTSDDMDDNAPILLINGYPFVDDSGPGPGITNRLGTLSFERID